MKFTDENLKRLKNNIELNERIKDEHVLWDRNDLKALLSRLEAAEAFCSYSELKMEDEKQLGLWEAWRKTAGK